MIIEAVIFDLDGTLATFNLDYKTLRVEVRSFLVRQGVPDSVLSIKESIFEMLKKAEIYFKNNGKSTEFFSEIQNEALGIAEKYELEAASTTSLLPGALGALRALKEMKLKIGLCTISSEKSANNILQRFQIDDFFDAVVPRNKVKYVKPHPGHFEAAIKALKTSPEATVIVGDSNVDMQSAKELKAIAVGIPSGVSTVNQLMSQGANYIITSITDLPVLIEKINKNEKS